MAAFFFFSSCHVTDGGGLEHSYIAFVSSPFGALLTFFVIEFVHQFQKPETLQPIFQMIKEGRFSGGIHNIFEIMKMGTLVWNTLDSLTHNIFLCLFFYTFTHAVLRCLMTFVF